MHNDIIKEKQFLKSKHINLHTFPTFGIHSKDDDDEGRFETKFKRYNENETIRELTIRNCNRMTYEERYHNQLEEAEKNGYDQGFMQGIHEGTVTGKKEIEPFVNKLRNAMDELDKIKMSLARMAEIEAVNLSMAIAKKIVGNEISINKNVVCNVVKEALKKVDGHENIRIKVNPEEMQMLEESKNDLMKIVNCMQGLDIIGDENISLGGCIVETNIGDIDARIEKQFKVVEEAFKMECL